MAPRLVRPAAAPPVEHEWDAAARRVLDRAAGFTRLLGGPGSGKTTLLVEAVARRIVDGADPEQVLVLTPSRRAAQELRDRVTSRLAALAGGAGPDGLPRIVREPVVRTVHAYAFAVLRLQATLLGEPPPRLLSGPEQDTVVRELLAGDVETDGGAQWPERLRPALLVPGFAAELRDLLLRAAERGLGPEDLRALGVRHRRPEWVAAGRFFETYEQVTILRGSAGTAAEQATAPALDAAELVAAALLAFDTDPEVLDRERARVRHLFVDDTQHLDPLQAQLAGRLGAAATEFVVAGDPDQAVFTFRGADLTMIRDADPTGDSTVVLTAGRRMAPAVHDAVARLVRRLPGAGPQRTLTVAGRVPTTARHHGEPLGPDASGAGTERPTGSDGADAGSGVDAGDAVGAADEHVADASGTDGRGPVAADASGANGRGPVVIGRTDASGTDGRGPAVADVDGASGRADGGLSTAGDGAGDHVVMPKAFRRAAVDEGAVRVRLLRSDHAEASWVADQLRRAHLVDGVPWRDMAVLVRSTTRSLPVLRRALLAAGVPLAVPRDELPLGGQPAVWPLLTLIRAAVEPDRLDEDSVGALLASPYGGADPLGLRRLRREVRRLAIAAGDERSSGPLLVQALRDGDPLTGVDDRAAAPLRRLVELMALVREHAGAGVEEVLWQVWRRSGLERRWTTLAARGGSVGAQADRDLDSVVALFDAAGRYVDRLPGATVAGFADYLRDQQIPGDSLAPRAPSGDAVEVLTAHSAAGREWTVVAVPGVQEGTWPDLRLRGSLLGVERLVDTVSGVTTGVSASGPAADPGIALSATAPLLAEERRLLVVAASRARHTLLVSAVHGEEEQPSRFLAELTGSTAGTGEDADPALPTVTGRPERALVLSELVGELRRVVCSAEEPGHVREHAARQLARLAAESVPGAHPDEWSGLAPVSVATPLFDAERPVTLSPSTLDLVANCPLRWLLQRHGGDDGATLPSVTGMLVHALIQLAATGADDARLDATLRQAWTVLDAGAPWFSRREHERVRAMLTAFRDWLSGSRAELEQVAVELDVDVVIPGAPAVRIRGRVDRLERDGEGRPVIVDVKTSKNPISKDAALAHPQLAVYQVAASLGAFEAAGTTSEPGGARLLYVSRSAERTQPALDADARSHWIGAIQSAAASTIGPEYTAHENPGCDRCPARTACPLTSSGRQITQ